MGKGLRLALAVLAALVMVAGCSGPKRQLYRLPSPSPTIAPTATGLPVPGYLLNPAVTQATIHTTICVAGWTDMVRPPSSYTTALKRSQLPPGADLSRYEEDHLIPLELGGAPREPRNLWPEPINDARRKDVLENRLHAQVCDGSLALAAARLQMYDWPPPSGGTP